jgi:hypothetical protein
MTGSAAKGAVSANLRVVPDLDKRAARFARVEMPFRTAGLSAREIKLVHTLVEASQFLEEIYWRQVDPEALTLYESLSGSKDPRDQLLRRYLGINATRFDLLDAHKPFVGTAPMYPGRGFYPAGLTREEIETYVKAHPDKKDEIYSQTTIVRRHDGELEGLPYHIAFRSFLEPAARKLREAADLSDDRGFAEFLRLRADALLSDDYYKSDLAWLQLRDPKIDIIFAPYETYDDKLLGVKATYGVAVMVRNEQESGKVDIFRKYEADIQDALPLPAEDRPSKRGFETPMEVMDTPYRAADLRHGYQAVADNLPNDPRIHEQKGSKKLFFKNFMDARVNYVIVPVARRVMLPEQAAKVTAEGYLLDTMMHEFAHGLGPVYSRTAAGKVDIREAIGPIFGGLEEAKADTTGMLGLNWLVEHGVLPKSRLEEFYASYVGGMFRTLRFGAEEAHGQAQMMEFNYLLESGALTRTAAGRYAINFARIPSAVNDLAKELLEMEATGDRLRAENWFKKYDVILPALSVTLKEASSVPIDVDPVFSFKEKLGAGD